MPLGAVPAVVVMLLLSIGAVVGLVSTSLRPGAISGGAVGLDAWRAALSDPGLWDALGFTLWIAAASTALATAVGLGLVVASRRRRWVRLVVALPVPVPHLVVAALAVAWLAPGGLADRLLGGLPVDVIGDRFGIGIILTYVYKEAPFLALLALAAWDGSTVRLEEVAAALGAGPWRRWVDVVLPRLAPPLVLGGTVVSAFVIGATEVPLVVGRSSRHTLSTYALHLTALEGPIARAEAAAVLAIAVVVVLVVVAVPATLLLRGRAWS